MVQFIRIVKIYFIFLFLIGFLGFPVFGRFDTTMLHCLNSVENGSAKETSLAAKAIGLFRYSSSFLKYSFNIDN